MSTPSGTDARRIRKHFAAFAHNLRQVGERCVGASIHVSVISDRCAVVHPGPGQLPVLVEPRFLGGPSGAECFIQCRESTSTDEPALARFPLVAVWRCDARGVVTRHPEDGSPPLGYLCDSVVAAAVLRTLTERALRRPVAAARLEHPPWSG